MRIAFNAHFLTQPMTGSGQYAQNLLTSFAELDGDNEYVIVAPRSEASRQNMQKNMQNVAAGFSLRRTRSITQPRAIEENSEQTSFSPATCCASSEHPELKFRYLKTPFDSVNLHLSKTWFEQLGVPNIGLRENADILHYPYFAAPLLASSKVVVTIHDVIPLLLEPYRGSRAVQLYTSLVSTAARRAF